MYISESSVSKGKYVKFSPYTLWHTSFPPPKKKKDRLWSCLLVMLVGNGYNFNRRQNFYPCPNWRHLQTTNKCCSKHYFSLAFGRKQCGKRRKCWLPAFSPFPTMFSKGFFFRVVKSRDRVVMVKNGTKQFSVIMTIKNDFFFKF